MRDNLSLINSVSKCLGGCLLRYNRYRGSLMIVGSCSRQVTVTVHVDVQKRSLSELPWTVTWWNKRAKLRSHFLLRFSFSSTSWMIPRGGLRSTTLVVLSCFHLLVDFNRHSSFSTVSSKLFFTTASTFSRVPFTLSFTFPRFLDCFFFVFLSYERPFIPFCFQNHRIKTISIDVVEFEPSS